MAEPEWGLKRICPSCGVRFYDLTNNPTTCPSCAESFPLEALSERKSTASSRRSAKAEPVKAAAVAEVDDDDVLDDDDEDDDDDVSSDVLLDDDDDDDGDLGDIAPERKGDDDDS
ncbi:TIGR02300 family protein [Rhodovulum sp. DZ06]|uniref:TIGR02300 family protein n=1 Tax=Rhodovulum sp. DZ06 TaxID=3425126 RepID=UPI003D354A43